MHMVVPKLDDSVRFYSGLFGAEPTVLKDDYAKWMLEDPRGRASASNRGTARYGRPYARYQLVFGIAAVSAILGDKFALADDVQQREWGDLMARSIGQGPKQRGDVHVFIKFGPEQLLTVHGDSKMLALLPSGCLKERKPVQRETDFPTVREVEEQVRVVEAHTNSSALHGRLLKEHLQG